MSDDDLYRRMKAYGMGAHETPELERLPAHAIRLLVWPTDATRLAALPNGIRCLAPVWQGKTSNGSRIDGSALRIGNRITLVIEFEAASAEEAHCGTLDGESLVKQLEDIERITSFADIRGNGTEKGNS